MVLGLTQTHTHAEHRSLADGFETDSVCTQIPHLQPRPRVPDPGVLGWTPRQSWPDMTGSADIQPV